MGKRLASAHPPKRKIQDYSLLTMRALIVADVHANLEALEAVIADARSEGWIDVIWCLGDIVGYGPQPRECIAMLRGFPHLAIAGNHDLVAIDAIGLEDFNSVAAASAVWTRGQISGEDRTWLAALPSTVTESEFTLVHGSLSDPVWHYLTSAPDAESNFQLQTTPYCLIGHSHLPLAFVESGGQVTGGHLSSNSSIQLNHDRVVANPGGLGQPRDGDPRACYALLDTGARRLDFRRVAYDIEKTQDKMREAGLPGFLIDRLKRGQ